MDRRERYSRCDTDEQFYHEVFPAELEEIARRRRCVLGDEGEPIHKAIKAIESMRATKEKSGKLHWKQWLIPPASLLEGVRKTLPEWLSGETSPHETDQKLKDAQAAFEQHACPSTALGLIGLAFSGGGIRSATFNLGVLQALAECGFLKRVDYLSTVSGGGYIGSCLSSVLNNGTTTVEGDGFPLGNNVGAGESEPVEHLRSYGNYLAPGGAIDLFRMAALMIRGIALNFLVFLPFVLVAVCLMDIQFGDQLAQAFQNLATFEWKEYVHTYYLSTPWLLGSFLVMIILFLPLSPWLARTVKGRDQYEKLLALLLAFLLTAFLWESLPAALIFYHKEHDLQQAWGEIVGALVGIGFISRVLATKWLNENLSKWMGKLPLVLLGVTGPLILLWLWLGLEHEVVLYRNSEELILWPSSLLGIPPTFPPTVENLLQVALGLWILALAVDVNTTSLHSFYCDRLNRAYLFTVDDSQDRLVPNLNQKLSKLNAENTQAPYHILNATLNLQGSDSSQGRARKGDFFIFSKRYSGSVSTGFCKTTQLEGSPSYLDLGDAMAISGAAVAPNMGKLTVKPLVFLMTLLNFRLGYWLPNPYYLRGFSLRRIFLTGGAGPAYLLFELLRRIDEKKLFVYITDGGHIENLGIYELLRRRCKLIIASDAVADPDMRFADLVALMRYAKIDLGIRIDINLDALRKSGEGSSKNHHVIGKIHYGENEPGTLVYFKSSVTDDEPEYLRIYRSLDPSFPHEPTRDQFFDEARFEAYRALGYHIASEACDSVLKEASSGLDMERKP